MNLERANSGSYRTPILRPSISINNKDEEEEIIANTIDEKMRILRNNCAKDYSLSAIVFNAELMKRIKK